MREAVGEQRLHPAPAEQNLQPGDVLRGRVAIAGRGDVGVHLDHQPLPAVHGEKKGRDT